MSYFPDACRKSIVTFLLLSAITSFSHSSHSFLLMFGETAIDATTSVEESQNLNSDSNNAHPKSSRNNRIMVIYSPAIRIVKEGDHYKVITTEVSDDSTSCHIQ